MDVTYIRGDQIGDWTTELFRLGLRKNPSQPLWITAAQPSPVERTLYYENGATKATTSTKDSGEETRSIIIV